jgi:hypothetical protein
LKHVQEANSGIHKTCAMWSKKFSKKTLTSALFKISCGFKGGKDLCCAGLK